MKKKILGIVLVLAVSCSAFGMSADTAQAMSKSAKAKKAYARILSSAKAAEGIIDVGFGDGTGAKFALLDLNKDGVPELIFTPDDGYHVEIASYIKGKARNVGGGFSGSQAYYPNKHIYFSQTTHTGDDEYSYYKFNGKKMKVVAEKYGSTAYNAVTGKKKTSSESEVFAPYKYTVNGKTVSKKKYKAYVKKLLSGAKKVKPKWHKNTASNRKKYL